MNGSQRARGFTLIELMVVIGLIGLLTTIVIVSLNAASTRGRDSRRLEDIKQIRNALQIYFDSHSVYPNALTDLVPNEMPVLPHDPIGNANYVYDLIPGGTSFHIGANLERADNIGLQSDADTNSATIVGNDATSCSGSAATGRHCYDMLP